MNPPSQFGFGIVGTGMIAGFHARAIAQVPGARLVGVASRSPEKGRAFAKTHVLAVVAGSVEELAARPDIDVICITTPSGGHLEPALAAIEAGKHVVIEKPLEVTTERVDRILAAAAKKGVRVAPIFQGRFGDGARAVKAVIAAGRLGRLVLCSAAVKWHRPPSYYTGWKGTLILDGGGATMNQAIHGIDLLQWFAGMPTEVFSWKTRRVHTAIEAEDTACASLKFPDGALGTIEATTAAWPGWSRRIEICGERGSLALEDDRIARWDFASPEPGDDTIRNSAPAAAAGAGAGAGAPGAIPLEGHVRQFQDLIDALRENRPLALEGPEARKAVALVNALYESAERGVPVRLK
jgi:UDP-N-acetyl-2-amino-2-deoxyglucuronate dehydrogenase